MMGCELLPRSAIHTSCLQTMEKRCRCKFYASSAPSWASGTGSRMRDPMTSRTSVCIFWRISPWVSCHVFMGRTTASCAAWSTTAYRCATSLRHNTCTYFFAVVFNMLTNNKTATMSPNRMKQMTMTMPMTAKIVPPASPPQLSHELPLAMPSHGQLSGQHSVQQQQRMSCTAGRQLQSQLQQSTSQSQQSLWQGPGVNASVLVVCGPLWTNTSGSARRQQLRFTKSRKLVKPRTNIDSITAAA
mmetsp:Transcript_37510/g.86548  ORF Transcript_37510/g.86548 Transcript_37510/m.86548 type:complete len:244 (+) Transcript_37510:98-829(+)